MRNENYYFNENFLFHWSFVFISRFMEICLHKFHFRNARFYRKEQCGGAGFNDEKNGVAVYFTHYIHYTADSGRSWMQGKQPLKSSYLGNLEICGERVWTVGGNQLLFSKNFGAQWISLPNFGGMYDVAVISFLNESIGWYGNKKELFLTRDGGLSWKRIVSPVQTEVHALDMITPDSGILLEKNLLYFTADGGQNWRQTELPFVYLLHTHDATGNSAKRCTVS